MMEQQRIVLVEDDTTIGSSLTRVLNADWDVVWVEDSASGVAAVDDSTALVLLDLGLPDVDGVETCRQLSDRWPTLPIIILTARRNEVDVVVGLNAGAIDYVVKPFRLGELKARIQAQLRR